MVGFGWPPPLPLPGPASLPQQGSGTASQGVPRPRARQVCAQVLCKTAPWGLRIRPASRCRL